MRAAHIAERAYRLITRYLDWRPAGRVSITLNDQTDSANGFASSIPYNYIFAYAAPRAPWTSSPTSTTTSSCSSPTSSPTSSTSTRSSSWCPRFIDTVFGKIYAPNLSQPTWFIEGLAVLMESRQTTAGRLRSSFFNMYLRVPFLEGRVLGLDTVSSGPLAFPQGTAFYLYGSSMLSYVEDRYGPEKLREISHRYGDECIAGGLNRVTARAIGRGYTESPGTASGRIGDGRCPTVHARDGGRRATGAHHREPHHQGCARPRRRGTERPTSSTTARSSITAPTPTSRRRTCGSIRPPARAPSRRQRRRRTRLAHPRRARADLQRVNYMPLTWRISGSSHVSWNDLFRLDIETGTIRQLTLGWRAHDPDVSPDGTQIACVVASGGARQLALVPIEGGVPRVLTPGAPGFAYTPVFSPDGQRIAYSRWKPGGFRDIHLYDLATAKERALFVDRAMDIDPRFSPDGRFLLFASDRTGIYDIYAYELATARLYQVTNVVSGAFQPAVSPDGATLVYGGFTSDGFDLWATRFDPAAFLPAQPYANARLDSPADPDSESDSPDAAPEDAAAVPFVTKTKIYQPWKYLYPRTWDLRLLTNPLGPGDSAYIATTISDPVGNHGIAASLLLSTELDPSVALAYSYNRLWPSFGLSARRAAQEVGGLVLGGVNVGYRQNVVGASASVGLPVLVTAAASADVTFGYDYTAYGPADPIPVADPTAPSTIAPERGPDADVYVLSRFSNAHSWPYSVSGQEGRRLSLFLRIADPALGGRFRTTQVSWGWTEYLTPPWARLHALALMLSGGIGIGDKRGQFAIGGFVEQDLVRAIFLNQREQGLFLRGYPPYSFVGDAYQLLSAEYRAPLVWIEHGYRTFPLYLRRIWGAMFVDAGNAYYGRFDPQALKVGAGAEAHLQFNLAYYLETDLKIGYAHGFSAPGGDQVYFVAAASF